MGLKKDFLLIFAVMKLCANASYPKKENANMLKSSY